MSQFLIVYEKSTGLIRVQEKFEDERRSEALAQRAALERKYGALGDIEVVVLGARDETDLRRTHSRYFSSLSELASA